MAHAHDITSLYKSPEEDLRPPVVIPPNIDHTFIRMYNISCKNKL